MADVRDLAGEFARPSVARHELDLALNGESTPVSAVFRIEAGDGVGLQITAYVCSAASLRPTEATDG